MSYILKLLTITLSIRTCISAENDENIAGYYRYKVENNDTGFYPMSLDQVRDSPAITSLIDRKNLQKIALADKEFTGHISFKSNGNDNSDFKKELTSSLKISALDDFPTLEPKSYTHLDRDFLSPKSEPISILTTGHTNNTPYYEQSSYFGSKSELKSSPIQTYFDETHGSGHESQINQGNINSGQIEDLSSGQISSYLNSVTKPKQALHKDYHFSNPAGNHEPWTPLIRTNSYSEPNYEQYYSNNFNDNFGKKDEPKSLVSNNDQQYYRNQFFTNFKPKQESKNSQPNYEQQKYENKFFTNSDFNEEPKNSVSDYKRQSYRDNLHTDYAANPRPDFPNRLIYVNHVPNYEETDDDSDSEDSQDSELLSRIFNLNRNRFRAKRIIMNDLILS